MKILSQIRTFSSKQSTVSTFSYLQVEVNKNLRILKSMHLPTKLYKPIRSKHSFIHYLIHCADAIGGVEETAIGTSAAAVTK